jgi:hypothetical protein
VELKEYYGADVSCTVVSLRCQTVTDYPPPQADFAGTNSQATAERSRRLGWRPRAALREFLDSLDSEVEMIWKEEFEPRGSHS